MRGRTAIAFAGAVAGAALCLPGAAHAATGTFTYHTQPGNVPHVLRDPADGRCYDVGADGAVRNDTDAIAVLYAIRGCRITVGVIEPEESREHAEFGSVKFVPDQGR
ncbi:hypothetical protein ACH35V_29665 [Actinomadura sp. 1N219]|uniref:hypothetical protein n=1 Tax=Actinomadura sp. 1N219 TaxID=3375152 RepID=UPI0037B573D6